MAMRDPSLVAKIGEEITGHDGVTSEWASRYVKVHEKRFIRDLSLIRQFLDADDGPVLEIGSAPFLMTTALEELGYDVIGLDLEPDRFADFIARRTLRVERGDIEASVPLPSGSVANVVMNEVFEHLRYPLEAIREVARVLRPGGRLLLSTPNMRSARGVYRLVVQGRGWAVAGDPLTEHTKPESIGHMGHVREYTPTEVTRLVDGCGFDTESIVFRAEQAHGAERLVCKVLPPASPFFSLVASRVTS